MGCGVAGVGVGREHGGGGYRTDQRHQEAAFEAGGQLIRAEITRVRRVVDGMAASAGEGRAPIVHRRTASGR